LGLVLIAGGSVTAALSTGGAALPVGLALIVIGVTIAATGFGRALSHLEVHSTKLVWTWWFSRHEIALEDVESAALVEPGSPNSGGEWGAFVAGSVGGLFPVGGLVVVAAWWLYGLALSTMRAEPTLGSHALFIVRHYGPPERVEPIGTFAFSPAKTTAARAQRAIQAAIDQLHKSQEPAAERQPEAPPPFDVSEG
jgi:hypothetical protein